VCFSLEIPHLFSMLCYRVILSKQKCYRVIGQFFFFFYRGELKYLNYESAILFVFDLTTLIHQTTNILNETLNL